MTPDEIIKQCDANIRGSGTRAKIFIAMPGKWRGRNARLLCKGGPTGQLHADLVDGKHVLVAFGAAEVKTYLEEKKHGNVTGRIGN